MVSVKVGRLYQAYAPSKGRTILLCGGCVRRRLLACGGIDEGSICWPGELESECELCGKVASAVTDIRAGKHERLLLARKRLLGFMERNMGHSAMTRMNRKLYFIEEEIRTRR